MIASRLQLMVPPVNPTPRDDRLRRAQVARTEQAIIDAATGLFLARGYTATTLASVAEAAQVGARTVYVRFGTKAALLKRVIDVAIVGDTQPVDVLGRDPVRTAMTAPTAAQRITAMASAARQIMQRAGALFAVAQEAAAVEPLMTEYWQQGRQQTRHVHRVIWTQMTRDDLLEPSCDLDRIIDTSSLLAAAETYLLITRMLSWDLDAYQAWLRDTLTRIAADSTRNP